MNKYPIKIDWERTLSAVAFNALVCRQLLEAGFRTVGLRDVAPSDPRALDIIWEFGKES